MGKYQPWHFLNETFYSWLFCLKKYFTTAVSILMEIELDSQLIIQIRKFPPFLSVITWLAGNCRGLENLMFEMSWSSHQKKEKSWSSLANVWKRAFCFQEYTNFLFFVLLCIFVLHTNAFPYSFQKLFFEEL